MTSTKSDPFDLLDIGTDADEEEVNRAFRALAKVWHPDISRRPDAAERFRAISEARDELLDPARRKAARERREAAEARARGDMAGSFESFFDNIDRFGRGRDIRQPKGPKRGADVEREAWVSLEQAHAGGRLRLGDAPGPCEPCQGEGSVASAPVPCPACLGRGRTRRSRGILTVEVPCPDCSGSGRVSRVPCPACGGTRQSRGAGLSVDVTPGARDGMRVRVPGMGAPGLNGGEPGDLTVVLRVREHPLFTRHDAGLAARIRIPVWEAALGTERVIDGIDGKPLTLKVQPGTSGGAVIVLQGHGMRDFPGRGDLRVTVDVEVPDASRGPLREVFERMRDLAR